jgi:predicted ABC-type ATPase
MQPRIIIVAGPNGAGKTTLRPGVSAPRGRLPFLNADLLAAGLSPFDPGIAAIQAARLMLQAIAHRVSKAICRRSAPLSHRVSTAG